MNKKCTTCKIEKNANEFPNDKKRKDGKRPECKVCKKLRDKTYRLKHNDKKSIRDKQYYINNSDEIKKRAKKWYHNNFNKCQKIKQKYYQENKSKIDSDKKIWNEKNKEKMILWMRKYMLNRYRSNQNYKIKSVLNKRIRDYVKKNKSTIAILGCDIDVFKKWIEFQFDDKMSWTNYGKYWHYDHVAPCNSFDFTYTKNIDLCYNWKNLRPCEKRENIIKKDKIDRALIMNQKQKAITFIKLQMQ